MYHKYGSETATKKNRSHKNQREKKEYKENETQITSDPLCNCELGSR